VRTGVVGPVVSKAILESVKEDDSLPDERLIYTALFPSLPVSTG
jgi:hypothetical protein